MKQITPNVHHPLLSAKHHWWTSDPCSLLLFTCLLLRRLLQLRKSLQKVQQESGKVVETSSSEILETTSDDSEQACSKRRLDQTSYGIPFQFELFDDSVTFIAIKCCTRTACTQSPSDTDRQSPTVSSALMHLSFPKKSICKIFHPFSSCLRSFIFPEYHYNFGYQQSKMKKKCWQCVKKNSYQAFIFLPSSPPLGGGLLTFPHDTHSDTVFQQTENTVSVIQHSSAVTLLLALLYEVLVTRKTLKPTIKRNKLGSM